VKVAVGGDRTWIRAVDPRKKKSIGVSIRHRLVRREGDAASSRRRMPREEEQWCVCTERLPDVFRLYAQCTMRLMSECASSVECSASAAGDVVRFEKRDGWIVRLRCCCVLP
jgi:hypothetical protein